MRPPRPARPGTPRRQDTGVLYRPYSLAVVCATGALPAEHFTVSAAGVTHVCGGGGTDFTPLGQWAREALLLSLLCRIPFFYDFLAGRAFRSWHRVCLALLTDWALGLDTQV